MDTETSTLPVLYGTLSPDYWKHLQVNQTKCLCSKAKDTEKCTNLSVNWQSSVPTSSSPTKLLYHFWRLSTSISPCVCVCLCISFTATDWAISSRHRQNEEKRMQECRLACLDSISICKRTVVRIRDCKTVHLKSMTTHTGHTSLKLVPAGKTILVKSPLLSRNSAAANYI